MEKLAFNPASEDWLDAPGKVLKAQQNPKRLVPIGTQVLSRGPRNAAFLKGKYSFHKSFSCRSAVPDYCLVLRSSRQNIAQFLHQGI